MELRTFLKWLQSYQRDWKINADEEVENEKSRKTFRRNESEKKEKLFVVQWTDHLD